MPRSRKKSQERESVSLGEINKLVRELEKGVRYDTTDHFEFAIEHAQAPDRTLFYRAFLKTNGHVRATSKLYHATPGAAVDELWCAIVKE